MAGLVGGTGGGAPPPGRQRIFENLQKNFLRKLQKCIILVYFSKKVKTELNFWRLDEKYNWLGIF